MPNLELKSQPRLHPASLIQGVQKLKGDNLKVVWAEFSTLILAVLGMSVIAMHIQVYPI